MPVRHRILVGCWVAIVFAMMASTARLEWFNAQAGFPMPQLLPGPWRSSYVINEENWRDARGPRDSSGQPVKRELTMDEIETMHRDIERAHRLDRLGSEMRFSGLLQYPIAVLGLVLTGAVGATAPFGRKTRLIVLATLPVFVVAIGLAYYRGYFSAIID